MIRVSGCGVVDCAARGRLRGSLHGATCHRSGAPRHVATASSPSSDARTTPTDDDDVCAAAGSTLSEHARCSGTVVTMQANYLRVVVPADGLTHAQRRERLAQFEKATERARAAGQTEDAENLKRRAEEEGPYELLCVVRALLKKIKQRVLVVRALGKLETGTHPSLHSKRVFLFFSSFETTLLSFFFFSFCGGPNLFHFPSSPS